MRLFAGLILCWTAYGQTAPTPICPTCRAMQVGDFPQEILKNFPATSGTLCWDAAAQQLSAVNGACPIAIATVVVPAYKAPNFGKFLKLGTVAQGSWQGIYGADGYLMPGDSTHTPAYVTALFAGQSSYTWASSTTDGRALQAGTTRTAASWYASPSFTVDLAFSDNKAHQVSLYCLDWDSFFGTRSQTIDVLDAVTGAVLDSQALGLFQTGKYLTWALSGHVKLRLTRTAGSNAVLSGVFFDTP